MELVLSSPINKVGMNGVVKVKVKMEYPNDQPRDLQHFPVQIGGLLWWEGEGRNTARACLVLFVACNVFLWCFPIYCCGPMNAKAFLHISSFSTRLQFYNLQTRSLSPDSTCSTAEFPLMSITSTLPRSTLPTSTSSPQHKETKIDSERYNRER